MGGDGRKKGVIADEWERSLTPSPTTRGAVKSANKRKEVLGQFDIVMPWTS